jgi:hypothetical protein
MNICYILGIAIDTIMILLIIFMLYSKYKKEHEDEEDQRRADTYQFFQGHYRRLEDIYKNDALQYREWLYFGLNYGCHTPSEMKRLIDDLVKQINKLEKECDCKNH